VRRVGRDEFLRSTSHAGVIKRAVAVSSATVGATGIYAAIVTTPPGGATRRHHHGACDTAIYVLRGNAAFTWGPTGVENELQAGAGDFVHIPAGEIHVEQNASSVDDLEVLVCRNCPDALTVYVD
jgi:uncharacterized RmlC-like cupin family protein